MTSTKSLTEPLSIEVDNDQYFNIFISDFKHIVVKKIPKKYQSAYNTFLSLLSDDILLLRENEEVNIMIEYDDNYPEQFTVVSNGLYPFIFDTTFLTIDLSKPVNNIVLGNALDVAFEAIDNDSGPKLPYSTKQPDPLFEEHCLDMVQSRDLIYNVRLIDKTLGFKGLLVKSFNAHPLSHLFDEFHAKPVSFNLFKTSTSLNDVYSITLNSHLLKFYIQKDSINCTLGNNHFHMHTHSSRQKEDLKNLKQLFIIYYNMIADFPCRDIKRIVKLLEMIGV